MMVLLALHEEAESGTAGSLSQDQGSGVGKLICCSNSSFRGVKKGQENNSTV